MSKSRHTAPQVRSYSITHPPGQVMVPTQPGWDYLLFAHAGLFTGTTDTQAWTVPAHRALCVPDGTRVQIETARRAAMRCLYVRKELHVLDDDVRVVNLAPLTRELVAHAVSISPMHLNTPAEQAVITLLAERLSNEPKTPLHLPLPVDPLAMKVASSVLSNPAADLDQYLRAANASRRTVERRFKSETAMSLGQWRRRARVLAAVGMLAHGDSVTAVAMKVGYASPSSFVSAFKSELGSPPREFMQS